MAQFEVGHAAYLTGDLDEAAAVLPKAAYSDSAYSITRVLALGAMSMVAREQGRSALSHRAALEAMAVVDGASLRSIPQVSFAFTALGESEYDAGNLSTGSAILEEGLLLRRKVANINPWPTIYHLLAMGRVLTSSGDPQRAGLLLDEAGRMLASFPGEPGVMRARLARARAALRRHTNPTTGLADPHPPRARCPATAADIDEPPRAGGRPLRLPQHVEDPRPSRLPQTRSHQPRRGGEDRPTTLAHLISLLNLTRVRKPSG